MTKRQNNHRHKKNTPQMDKKATKREKKTTKNNHRDANPHKIHQTKENEKDNKTKNIRDYRNDNKERYNHNWDIKQTDKAMKKCKPTTKRAEMTKTQKMTFLSYNLQSDLL